MADALLRFSLHLPSARAPLLHSFLSPNTAPSGPLRCPPGRASGHLCPARFRGLKVLATAIGKDGPKWWEKNTGENMVDVNSTEEFLNILSQAGEKLVIVEFYGTWCASCRALFPKLCRAAQDNPDIIFVKVNFDANKPMCRRLSVKVLPYFQFYRGADGLLEAFSCSLAKFQKIKDAISVHNTARCSIGPPAGVGNLDLIGDQEALPKEAGMI